MSVFPCSFYARNAFDFKYIRPFEMQCADQPGPMVVFSSPGMLHSGRTPAAKWLAHTSVGTSFEIFKKWASDEKNMVIIPGYCSPGTVGAKILAGAKTVRSLARPQSA